MTHYRSARRDNSNVTCQAGLLADGIECGRARVHANDGRTGRFPGLGNEVYLCREHVFLHLTHHENRSTNFRLVEELVDGCIETLQTGCSTVCWEPVDGLPRLSWTSSGRPLFAPVSFDKAPWVAAHVPYALLVGGWPVDHELDHLCRNPVCVAPYHLEPVTRPENQRRKAAPPASEFREEIAALPGVVALAERGGRSIHAACSSMRMAA